MRRLAPLDKALVLIMVPLWVVGLGWSLRTVIRDPAIPAVYVSAATSADDYPTLKGFRQELDGESSGLRVGDRLIRVGRADLRGVGAIGFLLHVAEEAGPDRRTSVLVERRGYRWEAPLPLGSWAVLIWPGLPVSLAFATTALFLLLRAPPSPMVSRIFQAFMCLALILVHGFAIERVETYVSFTVYFVGLSLAAPLALRAFLAFPDGVAPKDTWTRLGPWAFVAIGLANTSWVYGAPISFDGAGRFFFALLAAYFAVLLAIVSRDYRRADLTGRRQIKWVLLGGYCALLPAAIAAVAALVDPPLYRFFFLSMLGLVLIPLSFLISVARYDLFDVDHVISAAASYNILLVLFVGAGLVGVPRAGAAISTFLGLDPSSGQIAFSLALAALLVPAHRRLRPQIERLFFFERYALTRETERVLDELSACSDPRELMLLVGERLDALLRPESSVIYTRDADMYSPRLIRGRALPPVIHATSQLVGSIEGRNKPFAAEILSKRRRGRQLTPFDRAALESLGSSVVVPVQQGGQLAAFLCLGPKHSGDVYNSVDLALLGAIGKSLSSELLRFDQAEVIRQGREMQDALRRYVPGAVAEQLSTGTDLAAGEREVTVLFVDIRGYTGFSESRRAQEVFSVIDRYTDAVSQVVQRHAGSVVEFNGDGMMAIFGAPLEVAHKEQEAVEAGREIIQKVAALPIEEASKDPTHLSVGVGIATGEAFVGNIHAVDRMIWTAIGNTTNLAARLQQLTRELPASVVIDQLTCERAQTATEGFEKRVGVPIRGRREKQDVYVLPMPANA